MALSLLNFSLNYYNLLLLQTLGTFRTLTNCAFSNVGKARKEKNTTKKTISFYFTKQKKYDILVCILLSMSSVKYKNTESEKEEILFVFHETNICNTHN